MGVGTEKKKREEGKRRKEGGREKESWVLVEVGSPEKCP